MHVIGIFKRIVHQIKRKCHPLSLSRVNYFFKRFFSWLVIQNTSQKKKKKKRIPSKQNEYPWLLPKHWGLMNWKDLSCPCKKVNIIYNNITFNPHVQLTGPQYNILTLDKSWHRYLPNDNTTVYKRHNCGETYNIIFSYT